jgi:hypothetical protein
MGLVSRRRKKGVNVVRFQMASTSHGAGDTHNVIKVLIGVCCSAVAKLGPEIGTSSSEKESGEMKEKRVATAGVWIAVPS